MLAKVNDSQRVFLTATSLAGKFVLRICVLHFRTHLDRMESAMEDIRGAAQELLTSI
jgi:aromatic-L-amino-acid decarboxylase